MKPYDNAFLDELSPAQREQLEQAQSEINQSQTLEARQLEEQAQAPTKSKAWDTPEKDFNQRIANAGARDFEIAALEDQESNRLETHLNLQAKEKYQTVAEVAAEEQQGAIDWQREENLKHWQAEHTPVEPSQEEINFFSENQSYEESNNIADGWASPEQIAENVKAQAAITGAEEAPSFRDELTTQSRETLERYEIKQEKEPMDISIGSEISQSQGEGQRLKAE